MESPIRKVTIVGGGSAGWLMAAYLISTLGKQQKGPDGLEVTLIESPNVPTIGVGEATVPGMYGMLKQLKINESEFMQYSNASFKCSGRFTGWNLDSNGQPLSFLNPFNTGSFLNGYNTAYHYHKFGPQAGAKSFVDNMMPTQAVVEQARGPRQLDDKDYDFKVPYTYHLNARFFAEYLSGIAQFRGVEHIWDDMEDVELDERGYISALKLKEHGRYPVEFVIDCTGFKGLILQKALKEPFIPYGKHLLCDRAVPVLIPHKDPTRIEPCTTATGMSAGWAWNVPLYDRLGTGYVYSSQFLSEDEAIDELMRHLGDQAPKDFDPKVIPMKIGRVRNPWVKNCIATGLSAGFVEPLEATAIFTIEMTARWLLNYFPDKNCDEHLVNRFNKIMNQMYDEIRSFIVMNYVTSNRPEPFWLAARNDVDIPDDLKENLELWKHSMPTAWDVPKPFLFQYWDYLYILLGKQYFDGIAFPEENFIKEKSWQRHSGKMAKVRDALVPQLPSHYDLLTSMRQ